MKSFAVRAYLRACKLLERLGWTIRPMMTGDDRHCGVRIHWRRDGPTEPRGSVVRVRDGGCELRFFVEDDLDSIQGEHRRGRLYEPEELSIIARHYRGGTFVDVGGNVGNHAIYAARVLNAARVVVFEPEPLAAGICEINAALNNCREKIEIHRVALSDSSSCASLDYDEEHNLGGTRVRTAEGGSIEVRRGDDVIGTEPIGFVKIDTEGFELKVLAGFGSTIARSRPPLFVEVQNDNIEAFRAFCEAQDYAIAEEYRRYPVCINYLAVPQGDMKD